MIDRYCRAWKLEMAFLKEHKTIFFIASGIFLGVTALCALLLSFNPTIRQAAINFLEEDVFSNIPLGNWLLWDFLYIFTNNIRATFMMVISGFLPFIFLSLVPLAMNGAIIAVTAFWVGSEGMNFPTFLAYILPHGIIEIPLLVLSASLGIYLCLALSKKVVKETPIRGALINIGRTYLVIILPGLLVAAFIETCITPIIGSLVMFITKIIF